MNSISPSNPHGPDRKLAFVIVLFALTLRLIFVSQVLRENSRAAIVAFNWDSHEYVHLAHNLATRGQYVYDLDPEPPADASPGVDPDPFAAHVTHQVSHHFGLLRTPGYPAFCAFFEKLGIPAGGVLMAQAVAGSLVPLGVFLLGFAILENQAAAFIAAMISAISSTGIGLCGIFLVDLLLSVCVIGGIGMLCLGIVRDRVSFYMAGGLFFTAGLLVKPSLLYWPLALVPISMLFARGWDRRIHWRKLAITAMLPWLAAAGWSLRNRIVEGGFTYCSVDAQNLRHFLAPLVEETVKAHPAAPAADDIWKNHFAARNQDWDDMASGRLTPLQIARRQRADSIAILKRHPLRLVAALFGDASDNVFSGWAYTRLQTPSRSMIEQLVRFSDRYLFFFGMFPCLALAFLAIAEPLLARGGMKQPENRRRFYLHAAILASFGYFFVLAGTSFSTGFRILYPAEFSLLLLTAGGVMALYRLAQSLHAALRSDTISACD